MTKSVPEFMKGVFVISSTVRNLYYFLSRFGRKFFDLLTYDVVINFSGISLHDSRIPTRLIHILWFLSQIHFSLDLRTWSSILFSWVLKCVRIEPWILNKKEICMFGQSVEFFFYFIQWKLKVFYSIVNRNKIFSRMVFHFYTTLYNFFMCKWCH